MSPVASAIQASCDMLFASVPKRSSSARSACSLFQRANVSRRTVQPANTSVAIPAKIPAANAAVIRLTLLPFVAWRITSRRSSSARTRA
jgi:hypothetical protein